MPQLKPTVSWKNTSTLSNTSISGWTVLAIGRMVMRRAGARRRNRRWASTGSKPPWLNGLQRSSRHAASTSPRSMPYSRIAWTA